MADAAETDNDAPPARPKGKRGLILGLVGALALGGGGFYAVYAGLVDPAGLTGLVGGGHGGARRRTAPPTAGEPSSATWPSCRWTRS